MKKKSWQRGSSAVDFFSITGAAGLLGILGGLPLQASAAASSPADKYRLLNVPLQSKTSSSSTQTSAPATREKPNILLIVADDMGWADPGFNGNDYYETPNLDKLRTQSMLFSSAYSSGASCSPSRSCMITGKYVPRHGVYQVAGRHKFDKKPGMEWNKRILLAPENSNGIDPEVHMGDGEMLRRSGYHTGLVGKWHIHYGQQPELGGVKGQTPREFGYDEVATYAIPDYWKYKMNNNIVPPEKDASSEDGKQPYLSDHLADQAIAFLEKNKDKRFFLSYNDSLVHVPLTAKKELEEKYRRKKPGRFHSNPRYAAMMETFDKNVGRILKKLDELNLSDRTLVIFTSDNGGAAAMGNYGWAYRGDVITSNYPLRGNKGEFYEGGIRVPLLVRYPGVVKPGSTCDTPVINVDFYRTFADVAGADEKILSKDLDGESIMPLLTGEKKSLDNRDIFWYFPGYASKHVGPMAVIRNDRYKLLHYFETDEVELFDLQNDIGEHYDLAKKMPELAKEMKKRLDLWRERTGAVIPLRNPNASIPPAKSPLYWTPSRKW